MKKLLSLLLAMTLVFGLFAFGNTALMEGEEAYDPFGRFDETVKLTQTRILTTWMGFDEGENEDNNWWTRTYLEQLNIELTNLFTAPNWGPDFDTKINVALATDDLPDVMGLYTTLCVKAIEGGKVMDLTEAFEKYASPQIKAMYEIDPLARRAWTVDGKLYGLAAPARIQDWGCFWIPQSMIDELNGGKLPETFAEVEELAAKIKEKTGSYAIGMNSDLDMLELLTYMFHGTYAWIEKDGALEFGKLQPETKAAWAKAAEWYQSGLLARDFASKKTDDVDADFANDKFAIVIRGENMPNGSTGSNWFQLHNTDDLAFVPVMAVDGQEMNKLMPASYGDALMVSSKCENVEAVFRLINLSVAISNDYGKPDFITDNENNTSKGGNMNWWNRLCTGWNMEDVAGKLKLSQMVRDTVLAGGDGQELRDMHAFNAVDEFDRIMSWINEGVDGQDYELNWSLWKMAVGGPNNEGSAVNRERMNETGRITFSPKWGQETSAEAANNQNMYAKYIEFATRAIMENNVDGMFQAWTDYYFANGGQDIYDEVNAWYDSVK